MEPSNAQASQPISTPNIQADIPQSHGPAGHSDNPIEEDNDMADADDDQSMAGFIGSLQPSFEDEVSSMILQQLGSTGRSYRREARQGCKKIVMEVYSPPRVTAELQRRGRLHLLPGLALDITCVDPEDGMPWDFTVRAKREKVRRLINRDKPYVLIGSPECKHFSTWQFLNAAKSDNPEAIRRARIQATVHLNFVAELYEVQVQAGRFFIHEHPLAATSWQVPAIARLKQLSGVQVVHADQCQYGAQIQSGEYKGWPIKKPTGFMSNSEAILARLSAVCAGIGRRCSRPQGGEHRPCSGIHARRAAIYPPKLCRAILRGITDQLRQDKKLVPGCHGIQVVDDEDPIEATMRGPTQGYSGKYRDDLTGQTLKD